MNKLPNSSFQDLNFDDNELTSHPLIQWFVLHWQTIVKVGIAALILILSAYLFISKRTVSREKEIFQADQYFLAYRTAETEEAKEVNYQALKNMIDRYPDLAAKYAGDLAQSLLIAGQVAESEEWAQGIFKRTQTDPLDLYKNYAQTSFLIAKHDYAEALIQAENLKQILSQSEQSETNFSTLTLFNSVRLALLYQELGQDELEKQSLAQLNLLIEKFASSFNEFAQSIQIGQVSLQTYIDKRLSRLLKNLCHLKRIEDRPYALL